MSFSAGGSASKSTETSQSSNDLPPWLKDAYQSNLAQAQDLAAQPFQTYGGQQAAGDNIYLSAARDQAEASGRIGQGQLLQASDVYSGVGEQSPYTIDAAQTGGPMMLNANLAGATYGQAAQLGDALQGGGLSTYMNPYQASVIDQSNGELGRQRDMQQQQNAFAASQAGAFGGSRHGVVDAENDRNFALMMQDNTNSLLNAGYDRATGLMTGDIDRRQQTGMANQSFANSAAQANADRLNAAQQYNSQADYAAHAADADRRQAAAIANGQFDQANTGYNLQAAQGLLAAGQQQQQGVFATQQALQAAGAQQQQTQQAALDAAYQEFLRQQQDPFLRRDMLNSALFGIQQGGLTSTSGSQKSTGTKIGGGVGGTFK